MLTRRSLLCWLALTPPAILLSTGCSGSQSATSVTVSHSAPAPLGETMGFTLTAFSRIDAPETNSPNQRRAIKAEVYFGFPKGIIVVDPQWTFVREAPELRIYARPVVFQRNISQTFDITVRLDQPGEQRVHAGAAVYYYGDGPNVASSGIADLFLLVSPTTTQIKRGCRFSEQC